MLVARALALLFTVAPLTPPTDAQVTPNAQADTASRELLRVFLDCRSGCDGDFFRTELTWVNFVRDRQLAEVQLLITEQSTGAGGSEYTLTFIGQGALAARADTAVYVSQPSATDDEIRRGLVRISGQGLLRYVRGTPIASRIDLVYRAPTNQGRSDTRGARDRWNLWVYRVGANVNSNGDANYKNTFLNGSLRASRTTAQWKLSFQVNGNYEENRFVLSDTETVTSYQRNFNSNHQIVKSLSDHWSIGAEANAGSSKFRNQDFIARVNPAIEYDLFPYSQSTRHQLVFRYGVGVQTTNYIDTTIYGKLKETHPVHRLVVASSLQQPWGGIDGSATYSQFLHDLNKTNLEVFGSINWRIVAGLSFNFFGEYSQIHDQLYLPKGELTDQDVFIRLRQLQTSYSYFFGAGLSYTFGSIFNSVVNPRFP
jgi:hypothetical protein